MPAPAYNGVMPNPEIATLGGGCFWCLEAVYQEMRGILSVQSGYMGGVLPDPDYRSVCTGRTGHIEVVQLTFDPEIVTYREILEVFFTIHDPTSFDRQGNDAGTQYRSVIFYQSEEQRRIAREVIAEFESEAVGSEPKRRRAKPVDALDSLVPCLEMQVHAHRPARAEAVVVSLTGAIGEDGTGLPFDAVRAVDFAKAAVEDDADVVVRVTVRRNLVPGAMRGEREMLAASRMGRDHVEGHAKAERAQLVCHSKRLVALRARHNSRQDR